MRLLALSFFERMNGFVTALDGRTMRVEFEIKCEAPSLRVALARGVTRATGVVHVAGLAADAPAEGTFAVDARARTLTYRLAFRSDDDEALLVWGRKDFDIRHPIRSMTAMPTEIRRVAGATIARGEMSFDLNDLPSFLTGFGVRSSHRAIDHAAHAQASTRPGLLSADRTVDTLQALAEVWITPTNGVPPVDARTRARLATVLSNLPPVTRAAIRSAAQALDVMTRARHRQSLSTLSLEARTEAIAALEQSPAGAALEILWSPIALAHFAREDVAAALGMPPRDPVAAEPPQRWMANVHTPDELEGETSFECDVVVVGSGAGGGPVAATLAEAGLAVAVIEEGAFHGREAFDAPLDERLFSLWRDAGTRFAVGNGLITVPTGRAVGGTTVINSGTCLRPPDAVLQEWRADGFSEDFSPHRFSGWIERVERELQVTVAERRWLGPMADVVERAAATFAAEGVDVSHGALPRNAPACDGQGTCVFGCPTDAKRSANVSWIPRALRAGAHVYTGLRVSRILSRDRVVKGVIARGFDANGPPRTLRLSARAVVVACGALESPLLLRDNDVRLPRLGLGLSIHPAAGAAARFGPDQRSSWRAIPQGVYMGGLVDPRVSFEGATAPLPFASVMLPFRGEDLSRWLGEWDRVGQLGFMIRDPNEGSVLRSPDGRPIIRYDIGDELFRLTLQSLSMLAEIMLRGGAEEVALGVRGLPPVRTLDEARALRTGRVGRRDIPLIGFHPLGTCAVGTSPRTGVVNQDHQVFGWDGLYVIDGASVPSSLGVNPQITIMAMALRAADRMAETLGA